MSKPQITGEQIKALLAAHRVSQTKAAELCHVNQRTFRRWVSGSTPIPAAIWELLHIKLAHKGQGMDFGFGTLEFTGVRYALLEQAHERNADGNFSAHAIDFEGNEYILCWHSGDQPNVKSVEIVQTIVDKLECSGGDYSLLDWGGEVSRDDILRFILLIV
jgi:transcriptional regulator with XRE-family HTH domain